MQSKIVYAAAALAFVAAVFFAVRARSLEGEVAALRAELAEAAQRPRFRMPPRPPRTPPRAERKVAAARVRPPAPSPSAEGERISAESIDSAVKARIEAMKKERLDARERRREAIAKLTDEQKAEQRGAFIEKMRERAARRMKAFAEKAGLSAEQSASFEGTVAALDSALREAADSWAEQIRNSGTFNQDSRVKFVGDMSAIISSGYGQMDETLPSTWREADGNLNLMEVVGPEAFSSVVEALTESGLEDGLQTIGQLMGGPEGGGEGQGGEGPGGDMGGIESPGVGDGPGGAGPGGGPGGMGGGGPGGAVPAAGR